MPDDYTLSILSIASTIITLVLFFSPWATFKEVQSKKSVGTLSCTPFIFTLLNCVLWVGYGALTSNAVVPFVNSIGAATSIYYIFIFYTNSLPLQKEKLNYHIGGALAFLGLTCVYIYMSGEDKVFRLGVICSIVSIVMFAAPLEKMLLVISTKSTESMIFPFAVMSTLCGLSWTLYGYMLGDTFVFMPNLLATLLGLVQLSLFAFFDRTSVRGDRKEVV